MMKGTGATMTTQYYSGPNYGGRLLGFLLALVLGAVGFAIFLHYATTGKTGRIATLIAGRSATSDTTVPAIVEKIQHFNRIETAVYSLDTVIEGDRSSVIPAEALGGDHVLLLVHGESIGGVDLTQLKPEDVRIDGDSIHVTLPTSQLFATTVDVRKTRVFIGPNGTLMPVNLNFDPDARAKAQDKLQQTALADGLLDAARKNARATITTLLYSLGFQNVDVM